MNYEFLNEIAKLLAPIFVCAAVLLVALIIFVLPYIGGYRLMLWNGFSFIRLIKLSRITRLV